MRIAQVAPLAEPVSTGSRGEDLRAVSALTDALVALGHQVTLFAAAGSQTRATLVPFRSGPLGAGDGSAEVDHLGMLAEVRARAGEFDLVHFHTQILQFPVFDAAPERTVTTWHSRLDVAGLPEILNRWNRFPLVAVSVEQRRSLAAANWVGTVLPGLPAGSVEPPAGAAGDALGSYLAFLGRIGPDQGIETAMHIARLGRRRLKLAGPIHAADRAFFQRIILPRIDGRRTDYVGDLEGPARHDFLSRADAALFPGARSEPSGLGLIEALGCGCPLIAFDRGAAPEVVEPGQTGFLVASADAAARALDLVPGLDRSTIRHSFETRFSAERMARDHVALYDRVLRRAAEPAAPPRARALAVPGGNGGGGSAAIVAPTRNAGR